MNDAARRRYTSLLTEISLTPGVGWHTLRRELESVHNIVATAVGVRADLAVLADAGLIRWSGEVAACTERGMDVARLRAPLPEL